MTDQLKKRLDTLRALAPRLNAVTDETSKIVSAVEKTLVEEIRLGVSALSSSFSEKPGEEPGTTVFNYLAFRRVSGTYRIHVLHRLERQDESLNGAWDILS